MTDLLNRAVTWSDIMYAIKRMELYASNMNGGGYAELAINGVATAFDYASEFGPSRKALAEQERTDSFTCPKCHGRDECKCKSAKPLQDRVALERERDEALNKLTLAEAGDAQRVKDISRLAIERDDARDRAGKAEQERDEKELARKTWQEQAEKCERVLDVIERRLATAVKALEKYGVHSWTCRARNDFVTGPCGCGFDAALASIKAKT